MHSAYFHVVFLFQVINKAGMVRRSLKNQVSRKLLVLSFLGFWKWERISHLIFVVLDSHFVGGRRLEITFVNKGLLRVKLLVTTFAVGFFLLLSFAISCQNKTCQKIMLTDYCSRVLDPCVQLFVSWSRIIWYSVACVGRLQYRLRSGISVFALLCQHFPGVLLSDHGRVAV